MPERPIEITAPVEKYRLECPNGRLGEGHTSWFPIDGVFRCKECERQRRSDPSIEPQYTHLRDKKTGGLVSRDEVELKIEREPSATGV